MPDYAEVHGQSFIFGTSSSDFAGFSLPNFSPRTIGTNDAEPEVFVTAMNGEGHVEAIAISKAANRKLTVAITGYISSGFDKTTTPTNFTLSGRFFLVTKISDPRPKGEFVECTVEAQSFGLVTS